MSLTASARCEDGTREAVEKSQYAFADIESKADALVAIMQRLENQCGPSNRNETQAGNLKKR